MAMIVQDILWVPIGFRAESRTPRGRWMTVIARMKNGVSRQQAQDDMTRVHAELIRLFPDFNTGWTARVVPLRAQLTGKIKPALFVLLGAVALVLLIACANVANLLLARASSRRRELAVRAALERTQEIGIRMALGAQRGHVLSMIVRQALVLAGAGILIGAAGAMLLTGLMRNLLFGVRPSDPLTFAAVAAVLGMVASTAASVPGLRATRVDPVIALRAE